MTQASAPAALPTPERTGISMRHQTTFLFTDIVGSTEMLTMLGEETWLQALREHSDVVQAAVERFGGSTLKFLGDGWMVTFRCPRDAVEASIAIQRALAQEPSPYGFRVRIGVHSGTAISEGGDYIGKDVVLASRITHEAGP